MKRILVCWAGLITIAGLASAQKVSKKEYQGYMAIQQATTPDDRITAVDKFVMSFKDSKLKSTALFMAADAAQQKGDSAKAIAYGQDAVDADHNNFQAMLLVSGEIAKGTRENDLDREEKLGRAEKLAKDAMPLIDAAPKPNPQLTDDQWAGYKKDLVSEAHEDLGLAAYARKNYPAAITEFKTAVDAASTPDPATMVRLAKAYDDAGNFDEGIAELDKVLATPNLNPAIQKFATTEKANAEKLKAAKK